MSKPMMLSDAIRLGATLGPQLFGRLVDGTGASCAIGAAMLAVGALNPTQRFPKSSRHKAMCRIFPALQPGELWDEIVHWNNGERLTREQIAERLVERGLDVPAVWPEESATEQPEAQEVHP